MAKLLMAELVVALFFELHSLNKTKILRLIFFHTTLQCLKKR